MTRGFLPKVYTRGDERRYILVMGALVQNYDAPEWSSFWYFVGFNRGKKLFDTTKLRGWFREKHKLSQLYSPAQFLY